MTILKMAATLTSLYDKLDFRRRRKICDIFLSFATHPIKSFSSWFFFGAGRSNL